MAEPPIKRSRANTTGKAHLGVAEAPNSRKATETASELVGQLSQTDQSSLLTLAAQNYPGVMAMLNDAVIAMRERERSSVVNFDSYSSSVWREINITYKSMRGAAQYEQSFEVASDVAHDINAIAKQCGPNVNPQTRLNGLSVLRKIGKTVCLSSGDVIAREVRNSYGVSSALVNGMRNIVQSMGEDEVQSIKDQTDQEVLYPKLVELHELAGSYGIFNGLGEVIAMLEDEYDEEGEDGEDDGEDGVEDGEDRSEQREVIVLDD
ncbi:hypothetical protein N7452_004485 [Penicillium brevicompactum]|uniref:Uncharacterized protein n=1 Tax=Penicillium brevicompactum TaxID=5074 RepID=A0A9W9QGU1_PENBR|nr:hypothetical protein N7452_004485 [Penicillium brevicompactum]